MAIMVNHGQSWSILYVITQADGGGAQKYVLALAGHFKGTIAAGNEATKLFEEASRLSLTHYPLNFLVRSINPIKDFKAILEIRKLVKRLKPDIVHLNSTKAGFLGSLACIGLKTKVIFTAHGFRFLEPLFPPSKVFYFLLEKIASFRRDYTITVSEKDKLSALKYHLVAKDNIQTIHNGLPNITFFAKDEARRQLHLPENLITFGTIANFYKTKGLDVLIKAVSLLHPSILDKCKFIIIGSGIEFEDLKLRIANFKLQNSFILTGSIPNACIYSKAFDAFILPSRKEGFPFAILEAMQAGLPIIASNTGGIPEALGDAGQLVKPEDPGALSKAIGDLLRNPTLLQDLSVKSRERSKLFTEQIMLEQTETVYKKLLL